MQKTIDENTNKYWENYDAINEGKKSAAELSKAKEQLEVEIKEYETKK